MSDLSAIVCVRGSMALAFRRSRSHSKEGWNCTLHLWHHRQTFSFEGTWENPS